MARFPLAFVLFLAGCASDGDTNVPDGDTDVPDPDAGLLGGCAPMGAPDAQSCPAGCVSVEGGRIDTEGACATGESLVVACYPEDASVFGDDALGCYRHGEDSSLVVQTPSITIQVEGVTEDLFVDSGWVRCDEVETTTFTEPCP